MTHWPAKDRWNDMNYLKKVAGFQTIPVEVGKNYLCPEWKQELITFSEFLERIQSNDCSSANMTYLAQHQLFDQIQELKYDIVIPDYCFAGGGEIRSLNAWFGPHCIMIHTIIYLLRYGRCSSKCCIAIAEAVSFANATCICWVFWIAEAVSFPRMKAGGVIRWWAKCMCDFILLHCVKNFTRTLNPCLAIPVRWI